LLARRFWHIAGRKGCRAQRVVAEHPFWLDPIGEHKHSVRPTTDILTGLSVEVAVEGLNPASEGGAVVVIVQRDDDEVRLRR
jgi:hypothetical protein